MNFSIRQYMESDLQGVLSSWENASKVAHPFLTEEFIEKERYNIPNLYLPNAETWVIDMDGAVKGFIALIGNEVGAIFVEPELHGEGLGKALMDKAQKIHGYLEVEVFKANEIGNRFYSKYGFQKLAEKEHEATGNILCRLKYTGKKV